jgi:hypothetical protein
MKTYNVHFFDSHCNEYVRQISANSKAEATRIAKARLGGEFVRVVKVYEA